jgi:hypothetical protein
VTTNASATSACGPYSRSIASVHVPGVACANGKDTVMVLRSDATLVITPAIGSAPERVRVGSRLVLNDSPVSVTTVVDPCAAVAGEIFVGR